MSKGSFAPVGDFKPWSPGSFDALAQRVRAEDAAEEIVFPTAAEIEAMHDQARAEGYDSGYREGLTQGLAQGQAESTVLLAFSDAFHAEITRLDETVAAEVATLALAVAQRVIGVAYAAEPELVARMVELALQALPPNLEPARVLLHADDLQIVAQHIGQDFAGRRIALVADRNLTRGGCRVVTASTDVDNTLESRWTRVTGVLGGQSWPALDARDLPVAAPIATTPARADAAAVASAPALPESS